MKHFFKRQLVVTCIITLVVVVGRVVTALTDGVTYASDVGSEKRGWFVMSVLLFTLSLAANGCYSVIARLRQRS